MNKNKSKIIFVIFSAILLLEFFLRFFSTMEFLEKRFLDLKFKLRADCGVRQEVVDTNIVFIAIDQKSLDFFSNEGIAWPWPRSFYAKVLDYLNAADCKAVIFDIDFSNKAKVSETDEDEENKIFAFSLKKAKNPFLIAIGNNFKNTKVTREIRPLFGLKDKDYTYCLAPGYFNSVIIPQKEFIVEGVNVGAANLFADNDGVVRRFYLLYRIKNKLISNIANIVYERTYNKHADVDCKTKGMLINWYGKGGPNGQYKYYSFASVLLSQIKKENNIEPIVRQNTFNNKIVFIGATAPSLLDYKTTPISGLAQFPSMEIHGVILNNLIKEDFIYPVNNFLEIFISLFLVGLIFYIVNKFKNGFVSVSLSFVAITLFVIVNYFLFVQNILLSLSYTIVSAMLSQIAFLSYNYFIIDKDKREIKKLFSKYVSEEVVEDLVKNSQTIELSGKEIYATAFFSDIKNFTTISEQIPPKELVNFLNYYFDVVGNTLLSNQAMLDKFIGDGIMAIFGAPIQKENHALNACKAAVEIQKAIRNAEKMKKFTWGMTTRIGINSGKMIVGNIGTHKRMDYTAIGDSVNIAARLESLNKLYGSNILISETTYELTKNDFLFREMDLIAVKGKSIPIKIYQLITDEFDTDKINLIKVFHEGLYYYRDRKWEKAISKFENYLAEFPDDVACKLYIERCKHNMQYNIPDSWDGVFYATSK